MRLTVSKIGIRIARPPDTTRYPTSCLSFDLRFIPLRITTSLGLQIHKKELINQIAPTPRNINKAMGTLFNNKLPALLLLLLSYWLGLIWMR